VSLGAQIVWLVVMALAIASISWTVTQEDIFRGFREYAERQSDSARPWWKRKVFYLFTCQYCLSHYVTAFFLAVTGYKLLASNWAGYVIALFALVWVANLYMSFYAWLRQQYKTQKFEAKAVELEVKTMTEPPKFEAPPAS
jgi:small-conductance mechanosensitive channel